MSQHPLARLTLAAALTLAAGAHAAGTANHDAASETDEKAEQAPETDEETEQTPAPDDERMRSLARAYMAVSGLKSEQAEEAEAASDPAELEALNERYRDRRHKVVEEHGFEDFETYESLLKRVEGNPDLRKRLARIIVELR